MSKKSMPSTFVKNILQNGIGRYVCQLQRVKLTFCKTAGTSRGVRDFVENHLLDFTNNNPGVVVYLQPKRRQPAYMYAEYLNGYKEKFCIDNMNKDQICKWIETYRSRSGVPIMRMRKQWHTDVPSVQGVWHPFMFKDPQINRKTFPNEELSRFLPSEPSATEQVLKMFEEQKKEIPSQGPTKELHSSDDVLQSK
ncbi:39S ribosomal protein L43, mitochondrial-like [Mytilus californianus]|uniref:39S ribosomal protein L43, mitochondrial-like n=1 Tax=Mytilus californianus TaxID=6549 RepID=UPI0022462CD3|nr:39S ribosomal protein L43, mitochondrial-like [Mytilus californianus]